VGADVGTSLDLLAVAVAENAPVMRPGWPTPDQKPRPDVQGWTHAAVTVSAPLPATTGSGGAGGAGGGGGAASVAAAEEAKRRRAAAAVASARRRSPARACSPRPSAWRRWRAAVGARGSSLGARMFARPIATTIGRSEARRATSPKGGARRRVPDPSDAGPVGRAPSRLPASRDAEVWRSRCVSAPSSPPCSRSSLPSPRAQRRWRRPGPRATRRRRARAPAGATSTSTSASATEVPVSIGGVVTAEVPGRVLLQIGVGFMPHGYAYAIDGVLTSIGAYDQTVSRLIRGSLGQLARPRGDGRMAALRGARPRDPWRLRAGHDGRRHHDRGRHQRWARRGWLLAARLERDEPGHPARGHAAQRQGLAGLALAARRRITSSCARRSRTCSASPPAFGERAGGRAADGSVGEPGAQRVRRAVLTKYAKTPTLGLSMAYRF